MLWEHRGVGVGVGAEDGEALGKEGFTQLERGAEDGRMNGGLGLGGDPGWAEYEGHCRLPGPFP